MAFVHVQGKNGHATATSVVVTLTGAATPGNLIVVNFQIQASGVTGISVTDNASTPNTYAVAKGETDFSSGGQFAGYQYYGVQVTGGATQITVSWTGSHFTSVMVDEFSGNASSNAAVFDKSSSGIGSAGTSAAVTSFSPTNTGELIVAGIFAGATFGSPAAGTNYALGTLDSVIGFSEYRLSGAASETAPASWTGATDWADVAGAYIPASGTTTSTSSSTSTSTTTSSTSTSVSTSTSSTSSSTSTSQSTSSTSSSTSLSTSSTSSSTSVSTSSTSSSTSTSFSTSSTSSSTSFSTSTSTSTSSTSSSTSSTSSSTSTSTTVTDISKPTGFIKPAVLTNTPVNGDATLVDDTAAIVDSPTALAGGPVTIVEGLQTKATIPVPRPRVKIWR